MSLVGIELPTIDARIVVASVDTYLRFAEAVNRLDPSSKKEGLPGLVSGAKESGAKRITKGVLEGRPSSRCGPITCQANTASN